MQRVMNLFQQSANQFVSSDDTVKIFALNVFPRYNGKKVIKNGLFWHLKKRSSKQSVEINL